LPGIFYLQPFTAIKNYLETFNMKFFFTLFTAATLFCCTTISAENLASLKVEYEDTPLGIDAERPRFSWQMVSEKRGQAQSAYSITVTDPKGRTMWNSGKTAGDESVHIEYAGRPLQPATRYNWTLQVWDKTGNRLWAESWFETGLMNPSAEAWSGAEWIGGDDGDLALYPDYLPAFNINYTVQLDRESGSTKAGFIFGANDPRLMNGYMNVYNLHNGSDAAYVEAELDISQTGSGGNAFLHVYRVGYAPGDDRSRPLKSMAVAPSIINKNNMYERHTVYIKTMYGNTDFYIDRDDEQGKTGSVTVNPIGHNWNFICFPTLCDIGFAAQEGQTARFSHVEVRNYRVPNSVLFAAADVRTISGAKVIFDIRKKSMPMLRTTFHSPCKKVKKARLYITARGIYEAYMNGEKIGDDYFNPGLTQYNRHHLYQTFDVTRHVRPGGNALGVMLGEGWWSGAITYVGSLWNLFGDRQSALAKLVVTYADDTETVVVSSPGAWSYFGDGPVLYGSFFQGEVYDARKEALVEGWTEACYDASAWKSAVAVQGETAIAVDREVAQAGMPAVNDFSEMKLTGQYGPTVKKVRELTAVSVEEVRPGVYLYDMGQNMAGVPRITLKDERPGNEIKLRFAEVRYPDLPQSGGNAGMIMLENIRGAMAQDIYIAKGGGETISPRFTFHGYRYVEVTGVSSPPPPEAVKGFALSSVHRPTAHYETSNAKVNRLWENITWSMLSNFLSIPTDCPQRNERMGWSGDISVFSRTATYMGDIPQFLRRHILALRDTQRGDGRFADVAPLGGGFGGILWGSAGITVPWENYLQYNDRRTLEEHYEAMKAYIDYLLAYIDPDTGILTEGNLGDWLGPEQEKNDNSLLWEACFVFDLELMRRTADALGRKEDAARFDRLRRERKAFFNQTYFDHATGETVHSGFRQPERKGTPVGTQTSYLLPLAFDICDEEIKPLAVKQLKARIENANPPYSLMTGFIGTAWINRVLSELGCSYAAYRILQQTSYPSWLYSVEQGATTIWERLNSYTREQGFGGNNAMNSFNHYSFGSVGSWMCNYSLGIERDETRPGFKHFVLQPEPDPTGEMTFAKGYYDSMYGRIESSWEMRGGVCRYRFKLPANTSATLYLQAAGKDAVRLPANVEITGEENGKVIMLLQSGEYLLEVTNTNL
jgi:alpha-L-rhamnosidase